MASDFVVASGTPTLPCVYNLIIGYNQLVYCVCEGNTSYLQSFTGGHGQEWSA